MPFLISFLIIAAAELGDKTQMITLGFATRYHLPRVIAAVSLATAVLMLIAVLLGDIVNALIPAFYLQLAAGSIFIAFGLWTIFGKEEKDQHKNSSGKNVFWLVFSTFFLAELGDKTQLATLALSARYGTPFQVWLGATLGMIAVNILAAVAGSWLKKHLSEKVIKLVGAALFLLFGLATLIELII